MECKEQQALFEIWAIDQAQYSCDGLLHALETRLRTHYIERALRETGGVKARAARLLNVTPQTFQNWVS